MKLRALVVIAGLLAACASQADQPAPVAQVQPAPYQSQHGISFKVVDAGSTYMQQLFEHAPSDGQGDVRREIERWRTPDGRTVTDYYLVAPSPDGIKSYLASQPSLAPPRDRELAFEQLDAARWRTYLVLPTAELDASSIVREELSGEHTLRIEFAPQAAEHLRELTGRITGQKLAVLVDGTVVAAPIVQTPISGGAVEVSFDDLHADAAQRMLAATRPRL